MSPRNWPTFPPPTIRTPSRSWLTFRHPFAICHMVCQPPPLPPTTFHRTRPRPLTEREGQGPITTHTITQPG